MDETVLGPTGMVTSQLCFGTWRFGREVDRDGAHELLDAAWDQGIDFFDTANTYGKPDRCSERWIGEWLADRDREAVTIASKVGNAVADGPRNRGLSRPHVRDQLEKTLDALGTDYLDIYYVHRWDDRTATTEVLRTLDDLVREGKVHHLGASTMAVWKLTKALWKSDVNGLESVTVTQPPFDASHQNAARYEGFDLEAYLDLCEDQGLAVCPYSPLAGGFLTGKYDREAGPPSDSRGQREENAFERKFISESAWNVLEAIETVADDLGATPAQVAIRWLIDQDRFSAVVPIVGARTVEQLTENAGAAALSLSAAQVDRIDAARTGA